MKYLINENNLIVREARAGDPTESQSVIELDKTLGELYMRIGTGRGFQYKYENGKLSRQTVKLAAMLNLEGDVIRLFETGSFTPTSPQIKLLSKSQAEELAEVELQDPVYKLPRYRYHNRKVEEIENLFNTENKCILGLTTLKKKLADDIAAVYPVSRELKISKDYMNWIVEGQPLNDPRALVYQQMQTEIADLKTEYLKAKTEIQNQQQSLIAK